ncbi:hypothetical protein AURDEDRAFT_166662 [Auricularia subglabra TFB-10046 SS5]|nr:hypothetical protein AURDEDRAFT_166662 [Auricularia subglabra TFB-10046 SS5]
MSSGHPACRLVFPRALRTHRAIIGTVATALVAAGTSSPTAVVASRCSGVAASLCRSAIESVRLVDFDYATLSNLNRTVKALLLDIGTLKMSTRIYVTLQGRRGWLDIARRRGLVVDAIDNIGTEVELLPPTRHQGAGANSDPTHPDRRAPYSINVPSADLGLVALAPEEHEKGQVNELAAFHNLHVRILSVPNYVLDDFHRGRSVIAPVHAVPARPAVVFWDPHVPLGPRNAGLMGERDSPSWSDGGRSLMRCLRMHSKLGNGKRYFMFPAFGSRTGSLFS